MNSRRVELSGELSLLNCLSRRFWRPDDCCSLRADIPCASNSLRSEKRSCCVRDPMISQRVPVLFFNAAGLNSPPGVISMTRTSISFLLTAILSTLSVTAATTAPSFDSVKMGTYGIDSAHTQVGFSICHFGFTNYAGLFAGATGTLKFDPAHPANDKLDVTILVDSLVTTVPKLTDELKGGQWFDVAKFPQATY